MAATNLVQVNKNKNSSSKSDDDGNKRQLLFLPNSSAGFLLPVVLFCLAVYSTPTAVPLFLLVHVF